MKPNMAGLKWGKQNVIKCLCFKGMGCVDTVICPTSKNSNQVAILPETHDTWILF